MIELAIWLLATGFVGFVGFIVVCLIITAIMCIPLAIIDAITREERIESTMPEFKFDINNQYRSRRKDKDSWKR